MTIHTPPLDGLTYEYLDVLGGEYGDERPQRVPPSDIASANIINSKTAADPFKHKVLLDLDLPAKLIPSTTEGHFHLYIDKEMPWDDLERLLNVMSDIGIIEPGYAAASIRRGYTSLRLPWVVKGEDESAAEQIDALEGCSTCDANSPLI